MAFNGTGSNVTSLNASNISSGTLAVARGGTGTASPSLVGGTNITISGTWPNQTVTAAGGGVTSLNGQTGAITNTDLYAIGSYISARTPNNDNSAVNATIAGSSLRIIGTSCLWSANDGQFMWLDPFSLSRYNLGGGTNPNTGTWRCLSTANGIVGAGGSPGLWVRIS